METLKILLISLILLALSVSRGARAEAPEVFRSESGHVSLVEVFVSDGCSSCPPAEATIAKLATSTSLWKSFIPVVQHVTYWNSPWSDPLSSESATRRQRAFGRGLLTPDLVIDGERRGDAWAQIAGVADARARQSGALEARREGDRLRVTFDGAGADELEVHVALLGFGIAYDVSAGENAGRSVVHDFAVIGESAKVLARNGPRAIGIVDIPTARVTAPSRGVAIWVSARGHTKPMQATGGMLR